MKPLYDTVSEKCSRITTRSYSTSFSLGIQLLAPEVRTAVFNIYGFVRLADEIVDSFHQYDRAGLLNQFKADTQYAIAHQISLNPILNAFQQVVHTYALKQEYVDAFLHSMEMDLEQKQYDRNGYEEYIYGSAEVVGLMCLQVFCYKHPGLFEQLKPAARSLGAAFQKVNFLRDVNADNEVLHRMYFPGLQLGQLSEQDKIEIEADIEQDFANALQGIKQLPLSSRSGVYLAYLYYRQLLFRIKKSPAHKIMQSRIRVPNYVKALLWANMYVKHRMANIN